MKNNLLTLIGTMLIVSLAANPVYADHDSSYTNYAQVTRVEPIYRYVTVYEPHKTCSYVRPSRAYNHHRQQRRFVTGESYKENRISTGTRGLRGTDQRNYQRQRNQNRRHSNHRNSSRRSSNHGISNRRISNRRVKHCVTTTVSRKQRQLDGYYVTYVHQGHRYQTRTDYHPGEQIKVRVEVKPH